MGPSLETSLTPGSAPSQSCLAREALSWAPPQLSSQMALPPLMTSTWVKQAIIMCFNLRSPILSPLSHRQQAFHSTSLAGLLAFSSLRKLLWFLRTPPSQSQPLSGTMLWTRLLRQVSWQPTLGIAPLLSSMELSTAQLRLLLDLETTGSLLTTSWLRRLD